MENLKIAWRNLWRNRKRTLITVASVFFGVIVSTFMSSMQEGSYSTMVDNVVKFYSGYIQVQNEDYWDHKTINNTIKLTDELLKKVSSSDRVSYVVPRLESFALASTNDQSRGTILIGIDPAKEEQMMGIGKWLSSGKILLPGDDGILLAAGLADYLKLGLNDTLVLLGQGYHGLSAAGKYPVKGIIDLPSPDLNRQLVYMDLENCQEFFSAEGLVSSLIVMLDSPYDLPHARRVLNKKIKSPYTLMTWDEMQPEFVQMIEADRAGAVVMKGILYLVIGFGILGTISMMLAERRREMGVLVAIGLQRAKLGLILFYETVFIGLTGVLSGFMGSIPLISYFYNNPVKLTGDAAETMIEMGLEPNMYFSWIPSVFYNQVITVFIITFLIGIIPVANSFRLTLAKALRA